MAVSIGALKKVGSRAEINLTSNSVFRNLIYVGVIAAILWSAIGYAIAG